MAASPARGSAGFSQLAVSLGDRSAIALCGWGEPATQQPWKSAPLWPQRKLLCVINQTAALREAADFRTGTSRVE